jgi:hypothetical protein
MGGSALQTGNRHGRGLWASSASFELGNFKLLAALMPLTVMAATAIAVAPSSGANAAPMQSCPAERPTEEEALSAASACGGDVLISPLTTETDAAAATAAGTIRWDHNYRPVRMRKGDRWTPIDTTLVQTADGRVAPAATIANVSFSGGGNQPMVTVAEGSRVLSLDSPLSDLPAPVFSGNTATYPNVLPDVDLQLSADVDGFSQVLVVRNAAAARNPRLKKLTFQTGGKGLRLANDTVGNMRATDESGTVVMTGGAPTMWDAAQNAVLSGRSLRGNGQMKRMSSKVTSNTVTLSPDAEMLSGADTQFPVYIDPGLTLNRTAWSVVDTNLPTTAYWNSTQEAQIGTLNGGTTKRRSYFAFELTGTAIAGSEVTAATLNLTETYSGSCTARQFNLYATGPISSATTWNNQPALGALQSSSTVAKGYSSSCPGGVVAMDATAAVRAAASNGGTVTLGLRAASETDNTYWKRFANNPTLSITYYDTPVGISEDADPSDPSWTESAADEQAEADEAAAAIHVDSATVNFGWSTTPAPLSTQSVTIASTTKPWGACGIWTDNHKLVRAFTRRTMNTTQGSPGYVPSGTTNLKCGSAKWGYRHLLKHRAEWQTLAAYEGENWRDLADFGIAIALLDPDVVGYRRANDTYCASRMIYLINKRTGQVASKKVVRVSFASVSKNVITAYIGDSQCNDRD